MPRINDSESMPDPHKINQQRHKIFSAIYMRSSMIAKTTMMIMVICSESCVFPEQLLPWEAQGGLPGTVPTPLCPTARGNLWAGNGCNSAEVWGTPCLSVGWPHHSQLPEEVQTREQERPPILRGELILGSIVLIYFTWLWAFARHAFSLGSYFNHFPLSLASLNALSQPMCDAWALTLPLQPGCPFSQSSDPPSLFLASSQLCLLFWHQIIKVSGTMKIK